MTKEEKINFLKQSFGALEQLVEELKSSIENGKEGVVENSANLIMGSIYDVDKISQHIKNIYEVMLYVHQKQKITVD